MEIKEHYDRAFNFVLKLSDISIIRSGREQDGREILEKEKNKYVKEFYFKNYFIELTNNRSCQINTDNSLRNSSISNSILMRFDYNDKDEEQFYEDLKTLQDLLFQIA